MSLYEPIQITHARSFGLLCPACKASVGRVEFVLTQTGQVMELDCGCRLSTSVWALLSHPVRLDYTEFYEINPVEPVDGYSAVPIPVHGSDVMYIYQLVDCTRPGV